MKMISIPEAKYNQLQEEVNSLRELLNQFVSSATKLLPRKRAAKELPPKLREATKVAKMTQREKVEHFKNKFK
jgi:hypothetical protein